MKKITCLFFTLLLLFSVFTVTGSIAERKSVVKDSWYIGAMKVINCREYVTLRETPDKTSKALAEVPLGEYVYYCSRNEKAFAASPYKKQVHMFTKCEYEGQEGYILSKFLGAAPDHEPIETKGENVLMSREEIIGSGEIEFEWNEFNVSVVAAREVVNENGAAWEKMRVGCFIDDEPAWGYIESVQTRDDTKKLKAFMGGTEDEPQVYVYDLEYGLMMFDLMDGTEQWLISRNACFLGDAAVVTSGPNTGILYVAGSAGPDPVAISAEGNILWQSDVDDPELGVPTSIVLKPMDIEVTYDTDQVLNLEYNGEVIGITDM